MIKGQLFITPSFFSHVDAAAQSQALSVDLSGIVSVDADSVVTHYGQTKLHTTKYPFIWPICQIKQSSSCSFSMSRFFFFFLTTQLKACFLPQDAFNTDWLRPPSVGAVTNLARAAINSLFHAHSLQLCVPPLSLSLSS